MSSSTNGMVAGPSTSQSPSGTPVSWEGDRMFNIYIYDYCSKRGFKQTAQQLLQEAELPHDAAPPINARQGLLFEWWSVFWVLFSAKAQNNPHVNNNTGADPHVVGAGSGGHPTPRNEDAALYIDHHQRQQQMRHMRNLPPGAAPGVGGPPPPPPGHPNSAALANPALAQPIPPGRLNGIPGGPPPPGMGGPGMRRAPPFAPARPPSRAGQIMPQGYPGMPHPSHAGPPPGMYQHPPHLTLANLEIEFSKLPAQFVQITKSELGIPPERDLGPEEKSRLLHIFTSKQHSQQPQPPQNAQTPTANAPTPVANAGSPAAQPPPTPTTANMPNPTTRRNAKVATPNASGGTPGTPRAGPSTIPASRPSVANKGTKRNSTASGLGGMEEDDRTRKEGQGPGHSPGRTGNKRVKNSPPSGESVIRFNGFDDKKKGGANGSGVEGSSGSAKMPPPPSPSLQGKPTPTPKSVENSPKPTHQTQPPQSQPSQSNQSQPQSLTLLNQPLNPPPMSQQASAGGPPSQPGGPSTQPPQPQPPPQAFNGFDFNMTGLESINLTLDHSSGGPGGGGPGGPTAGNGGDSGNSLFSPTMWGSFNGGGGPGGIGGGPGQVPPSMFSLDMGIGMDAGLGGMGGVVGGGGMGGGGGMTNFDMNDWLQSDGVGGGPGLDFSTG